MYLFLLFASLTVFAGTAAWFLRLRQASFAHPATLYLAFHGFVFVLRPLAAYFYEFDFVYRLYEFYPSQSDKITVILGANLAMLVFVLTAVKLCGEPLEKLEDDRFGEARRLLAKPILITAGIVGPLAVWSQVNVWGSRAREFETMIRDAATGINVNTTNIGWLTDTSMMLAPLAVLLVWLARYRWYSWPLFAGFAVLQAGTGFRAPLVFAVLAICLSYLLEKGSKWPAWRGFALMLAVATAFNLIVLDRGSSVRQVFVGERSARVVDMDRLKPLEHMDFANLEYFEYVVYAVPQRSGSYDYFANNLQIFTEPVPRALWPDKPVGSPVQFFSLQDYGHPTGLTVSLPGMGWMSLGYVGIVIQALVIAMLYSLVYRWLARQRGSAVTYLAYALIAASSIIVFRDGTLLSFVRVLPFYLGPLVLTLAIARIYGWRPVRTPREQHSQTGKPISPQALTPKERRERLAAMAERQASLSS